MELDTVLRHLGIEEGRTAIAKQAADVRAAGRPPSYTEASRLPTLPLLSGQPTWFLSDVPFYLQYANAQAASVTTIHAVECYRKRHAQYPRDLAQLVPEILSALPTDPMNEPGKPLRYRLDEKQGYVLYSVGCDAKDDGGRDGGHDRSQWDTDWVFKTRRDALSSNHREWLLSPAVPQTQPGSPSDPGAEGAQ